MVDLRTDAESIRFYCRHHELIRPHINWILIVSVIIVFELLVYVCLGSLPLSVSSFLLLAEAVHFVAFLVFRADNSPVDSQDISAVCAGITETAMFL